MTLRVGVDGGALYRPETGIGRYTVELIRGLAGLTDGPELRVLANRFRGGGPVPALGNGVRVVNPKLPARVLHAGWRWLGAPSVETLLGPVDVFHVSDWRHPPLRRARMVATVHDVGALEHPEWYAADVARRHQEIVKGLRSADAVIAVSAFTRDALLRHVDLPPELVTVVPSGVSGDFGPRTDEEARPVLERLRIRAPYVLYVGTRERRKNVIGLIEAFARAAAAVPELSLVVAGMRPAVEGRVVQGVDAWTGDEVDAAVRGADVRDRVHFVGQVPRVDLPALYSAASAFAFPTLYEGFGLPLLEAMACGVPVVASTLTAVPEVAGDAAILADPVSPDAFGAALAEVVTDDALATSLRERGRKRAASFTWAESARRTLGVYERARSGGVR